MRYTNANIVNKIEESNSYAVVVAESSILYVF